MWLHVQGSYMQEGSFKSFLKLEIFAGDRCGGARGSSGGESHGRSMKQQTDYIVPWFRKQICDDLSCRNLDAIEFYSIVSISILQFDISIFSFMFSGRPFLCGFQHLHHLAERSSIRPKAPWMNFCLLEDLFASHHLDSLDTDLSELMLWDLTWILGFLEELVKRHKTSAVVASVTPSSWKFAEYLRPIPFGQLPACECSAKVSDVVSTILNMVTEERNGPANWTLQHWVWSA